MTTLLYLPLSAKNFNSIFSTESISPESFYEQRGFGIFKSCDLNLNKDWITLYSKPYIWEDINEEPYMMWLVFEKSVLDSDLKPIFSESDIEIWAYPKTIYFSTNNLKNCFFLNEQQKNDTFIDAETSITVKTLPKYQKVFMDNPQFAQNGELPTTAKEKAEFPKNAQKIQYIEQDKRINNLKGFIYCYLLGKTSNGQQKSSTFEYSCAQIRKKFDAICDLILENIPEKLVANIKTKGQKKTTPAINNLLKVTAQIDELKGLIWGLEDFKVEISKLSNLVNAFFNHVLYSPETRNLPLEFEARQEIFKEIEHLETIVKEITAQNLAKNGEVPLIFADFNISKDGEQITFTDAIFSNATEKKLAEVFVCNALFAPRYSLKRNGEVTAKEKENMAEVVGIKVFSSMPPDQEKDKNPFYIEFIKIYLSHKNISPLQYDAIKTPIIQNFAFFLSKIEKLDELIEFIQVKKGTNAQFSLGMWGAFNGFALLDCKNFEPIFANSALTSYLDTELGKIWEQLEKETLNVKSVKKLEPEAPYVHKPIITGSSKNLKTSNIHTDVVDIPALHILIQHLEKEVALLKTKIQQLEQSQTKQEGLISKIWDWIKSFSNPFK